MKNRQATGIKEARHIARTAQHTIRVKTGIKVSLMLCPTYDMLHTPEQMLYRIAKALGMEAAAYRKRSRERSIVELRFIGAHFIRTYFPNVTLHQIAALFGGQDHSSVISGLMRANELLYVGDARFVEKYNAASRAVDMWLKNEINSYPLAATA